MLMTNLIAPRSCRAPSRSRGFGLLQVLLLIAVMAGLAAMGYLQWRERTLVDSSRQERQALAQADRAIITFATVMHRLPCADTNRDGFEDCTVVADQKGWLPSASLRLAGADPGVDVGQLRYLVQRGADANNLTVRTDAWRPLQYDEDGQTFFAMRAGGYPNDILTLTDFCQRLETARTTPLSATLAQVNAVPVRAVAYALAHPGSNDADGDGDLFDGANSNAGTNTSRMEDPARRPQLTNYNDIVFERSFASLQSDLQCRPLINSINTVALGNDVVAQVADMRDDNIESARRAVAFTTLAAVMTGLEIALAEWVGCALSLGLAVNLCAAAPQHTVAAGLAGGVIYANVAVVALNATAAGIAGSALTLADDAATPEQVCPARDQTLINQALADAQTEVTNAINARIAVQTEITNKTIERNNAIAARNTAVALLRSVVRGPGSSSSIDTQMTTMFTATGNWGNASYSLDLANSRLTQATNERNLWAAEVAKYDSMLADTAGTIVRLTNEIAALDAQIATNPPNKAALQDTRSGKAAELRLAQDPALLTSARDDSVASLATAQAVLNTATSTRNSAASTFNTARNNYQSAYANLVNGAARYTIYDSSGNVVGYGCTTACVLGDIDVSSAFSSAFVDLFGYSASTSPSIDAKYLKPVKLQKELDALNEKLVAAQKRETKALDQRDQVQQLINNPAPCNVTGSAVIPMTPDQAESILVEVDRKGGTR